MPERMPGYTGAKGDPRANVLFGMLAEWGLPSASSLTLLADSENATFLATAPDGRRCVLRLHRAGYNDAAAIRSEHAWIEALRRDRIVRTPAVLEMRDGSTIGTVRFDSEMHHVACFEFMAGREPPVDGDLPNWFQRLGAITAKLHAHSKIWKQPSAFRRRVWDFDRSLGVRPHWGSWQAARGLDAAGRSVLERAVAALGTKLAAYGSAPDRFGLIHADLRLANLLADGETLSVIDFDDCGFGWFMADFAAAVSFIEHEPIVPSLRAAWVEGYRTIAPLAPEHEAMLPTFVLLRRILLTAWAASRTDAETARRYGAWYTAGTVEFAERFLSQPSTA